MVVSRSPGRISTTKQAVSPRLYLGDEGGNSVELHIDGGRAAGIIKRGA